MFAYYTNAVKERCQFCDKIFNSLGRNSWRCKAKLHTEPLRVGHNHDNDIDFNINIAENKSRLIVNFNDHHKIEQPEGLVTDYDEQMQQKNNKHNNEV